MNRILNVRGTRGPLPEDVVYVGRKAGRFAESEWANPYKIGQQIVETWGLGTFTRTLDRDGAIGQFREHALTKLEDDPRWLEPLRGKRLACWCAPEDCHARVLLELLETYRPVATPGAKIEFGLHRMPDGEEFGAEAWPTMGSFAQRFDRKAGMTREGRKAR